MSGNSRSTFRALTLSAALSGALLSFWLEPAGASPVCTLSGQASPPLEVLPAGCELTLANGPVVFTGMSGNGDGNTHTVTITQFIVTPLGPSTFIVSVSGTNEKNSSPPTTSPFNISGLETETDTTSSSTPILDNATTNFSITSLLASFPPSNAELQLDQTPAELALDHGTTTVTDLGSGLFNISSFFDVFVDLSLDGTFGGTTGPPLNLPNSTGPIEMQLVLVNAVPEPASLVLLGSALVGFGIIRRRRRVQA